MNNRLARDMAIICLTLGLFLIPASLHAADLQITEISYNPEGSDADYEWLEIYNTTGFSIDLSDWSFYENEADHNLTDTGDGLNLSAGAYAVIARSPDTFSDRYPVDLLVGSSFSLVNGGEEIALTTPSGSIVSSVKYDPADGADGDGNSLQLVSGSWQASAPTPGEENQDGEDTKTQQQDDEGEDNGNPGRSSPGASMEPRISWLEAASSEEDISVSAGGNIAAWVGMETNLTGEIEGTGAGDDVQAKWLLGNGDEHAGASTSYAYQYPGEYVATFVVSVNEETFSDQLVVDAINPKLALEVVSGAESYVKIHNKTGRRFNLSKWRLESGGKGFVLPNHSTALEYGEVIIPHRVSGFSGSSARLYRPDGTLATSTDSQQANNDYLDVSSRNNTTVIQTAHAEANPTNGATRSATTSTTSTGLVLGTSTAAAGSTGRISVFAQWGAMLLALLLAAIGTVILMRRVSKSADNPDVQAAKFDINEINE